MVYFDQALADGQSQTVSPSVTVARSIDSIEPLKDLWLSLERYPDAII